MAETIGELQLAQSLLADVTGQIIKVRDTKSDSYRAKYGIELLSGDIARAIQAVEKAEANQANVADTKARVLYAQGMVARTVYTGMIISRAADLWEQYAAESFYKSIGCSPIPESYYQLGLVYADMHKWSEAITTLQQAVQLNDEEIRLSAQKAIGRIEDLAKKDNPQEREALRKQADKIRAGSGSLPIPLPPGYVDDQPPARSSSCFVATAVYGSPLAPQVDVFRSFRDQVLSHSRFGRRFIAWYYQNGPQIANAISHRPMVRAVVRALLLTPLLKLLKCIYKY